MRQNRVAILGGAGFIGRYVVKRLVERGDVVTVGGRNAAGAKFLELKGDVGQVGLVNVSIDDEALLRAFVARSATSSSTWSASCTKAARSVSTRCTISGRRGWRGMAREAGALRFIQMSAIGADPRSPSAYARTKAAGEAGGARRVPDRDDPAALDRVRAGGPVLQPLRRDGDDLAGDAADRRRRDAVPAGLCRRRRRRGGPRASTTARPPGGPTNSADPRSIRCAALIELLLEEIRRKRLLVDVPFGAAAMQARLLSLLPERAADARIRSRC